MARLQPKSKVRREEEICGEPNHKELVRQFTRAIEVHLNNRNLVFALRSVRQFFDIIGQDANLPRMDARDIPDDEPIAMLPIELRCLNALDTAGVVYVGQLRKKTLAELMAIRGITPGNAKNLLVMVGLGEAAEGQYFAWKLSQLPVGSR